VVKVRLLCCPLLIIGMMDQVMMESQTQINIARTIYATTRSTHTRDHPCSVKDPSHIGIYVIAGVCCIAKYALVAALCAAP